MNRNKRIATVLVACLLVITSWVLANTKTVRKWWTPEPVAPKPVAVADEKPDPVQVALLEELLAWLQPLNTPDASYYFEGSFTAVDKTDSAQAMISVDYAFFKKDNKFYIRNGQTETINTGEVCLYIDHEAQRIMLTKNKELQQTPGLPIKDMYDNLKGEGYTIRKRSADNVHIISWTNPTHISCKEFSVQYDSTAKQVRKIYFRQADISDPMDPAKEKWMEMNLKTWVNRPEAERYLPVKKFVIRRQEGWTTTPAYKQYELMVR